MTLYEVKMKVDRLMDDGNEKKVAEAYVVDTTSVNSAAAAVEEEQLPFLAAGAEQEVISVKKLAYAEVLPGDKEDRRLSAKDKYYKAKVAFITIDEKTAKEKKQNMLYLVNASCFDEAKMIVNEAMSKGLSDFEIKDITETSYLELYE